MDPLSIHCDKIDFTQPKFALFSYIPNPKFTLLLEKAKKLNNELAGEVESFQERNIMGIAKVRGVFSNEKDAEDYSESLIRNQDPLNSVFTVYMGKPFPITTTGYSVDYSEVDLSKAVADVAQDHINAKKKQEQQDMQDIKEREKRLREDVTETPDDFDVYIQNRVKLAHLRYQVDLHNEKIAECDKLIQNCVNWLLKQKEANPTFEENYFEKYIEARQKANIPEKYATEGFMKYINMPIDKEDKQ